MENTILTQKTPKTKMTTRQMVGMAMLAAISIAFVSDRKSVV